MEYISTGKNSERISCFSVSEEAVVRDVYYTGTPRRERAAVILRLAPNWFRFGSFEILSRTGELPVLRQLSDFVIKVFLLTLLGHIIINCHQQQPAVTS